MLPKHGFWPLNYIPFMLLVRLELTLKIKQILSLPRLPIPPQELVLTLPVRLELTQHAIFEIAASFQLGYRSIN